MTNPTDATTTPDPDMQEPPLCLDHGVLQQSLAAIRDAVAGIQQAKDAVSARRMEFSAALGREVARVMAHGPAVAAPMLHDVLRLLYWDHPEVRLSDLTAATGLTAEGIQEVAGPRTIDIPCTDCSTPTTVLQMSRRRPVAGRCADCRSLPSEFDAPLPVAGGSVDPRCPIPASVVRDLIEHLRSRVPTTGCDNGLTMTRRWAMREGVDFDDLAAWLRSRGGFCDCEVMLNVPDIAEPFVQWDDHSGA